MKKITFLTLFVVIASPFSLYAEELSDCVSSADALYESSSQKALDEHVIKLAELSLEKDSLLKNKFSFFSLKQSLAKMREIREKYKEGEKKEQERFKTELGKIRKEHDSLLLKCDTLSETESRSTEAE